MLRISNKQLETLIQNEGMSGPHSLVNATGVLRLALDLKEARKKIQDLKGALDILAEIHMNSRR